MPWVPLAAAAIGAISAGKTRRSMARQARLDRAERAKAKKELDVRIKKYEDSEYIPLDLEAYKQENVYEDLTVDTEAADYAMKQFQQSQANIMQGLQGVAGASGAAGLAQSLSLRAADQSRQTQLTLGQQLQQNRKLAMGEEARLSDQERQLRLADAEGRRQFDLDKMTTLIGVAGGKAAAANQNFAQSQSNQLTLAGQQTQMWSSAVGATDWEALGSSFGKTGQCFERDSRVLMFDKTTKLIQHVKLGDKVIGAGGNIETVIKPIVHNINDMMSIYTDGIVRTTDNHPLFVNGKWTNAETLNWKQESVFIDKLYNLEVKGKTNTFIVDDTIVSGVIEDVEHNILNINKA